MLINDLSIAQKQALAKEIRRLIEPKNMARLTNKIRETEIRWFLKYQKNILVSGISEIVEILASNYASSTIERLLSKIQSPIVWDSCITNLPIKELTNLISDTKQDIIITTSIYEELLRLLDSNKVEYSSVESARFLVYNILLDDNSSIFTVVDIPRENYVDTQLINYCEKNGYELYTYDYAMGLRARSHKINVTIFNDINANKVELYHANPSGKNVVLSTDLLESISLEDVLNKARSINANKFVLTSDFVEELEKYHSETKCKEYIRFFVYDECYDYTIYASPDEENDISSIVQKYDALVFSSNIEKCINYKVNFIPYKIIQDSSVTKIMSKYCIVSQKSDNSAKSDISSNSETTAVSTLSTESDNLTYEELIGKDPNSSSSTESTSSVIIPYYRPKTHNIPVKNIPPNELIWVLDKEGTELSANLNRGYDAYPGYTVIHVINTLNGVFQLKVYKINNAQYFNYGYRLFSVKFSSDNFANVPPKYLSYVRRSLILT